MNLKAFYVLFLISLSLNGIAQSNSFVDKIYNTLDAFVSNPKPENLKNLEQIEALFSAKKTLKTKEEFLAIVILNCNKAYYENQFGQTQKAISSYEKAWQIFQNKCDINANKQFDITENCLKPLGNLYTIIGDYDNAENTIKQYYEIAFKNKKNDVTHTAILNLAIVYQQSGKINNAIDLLEEMINSNQLTASEKALFKSNLGANYLLVNQNNKAEKQIFEAIKIFQNQKNQTLKLSNCYKNLSTIYFQKKDYKLASIYFETALRYSSQTFGLGQHIEAKDFYDYAVLLHKMNDDYKAKEYLNKALYNLIDGFLHENKELPDEKNLYADNVLLDILDFKAALYTSENQPKKALEAYRLSNYIEELFSNLLVYENSKIINQIRVRNRAEKCIAIYQKLYQIEKKQSYLQNAFLLSEKTKSGVLKNYLNDLKTISSSEKKLVNDLQIINNEIVKEQQKIKLADLEKINSLIKKQNQTMLLLKSEKLKVSENSKSSFDIQDLFTKLKIEKANLIEYFVGQNAIYSFVISENKIVLNAIENSESNKNKIKKFIDFFADPDAISNDISGYNSTANSVFVLLKISKFKQKNLIIIPDGLLNFVPFEALITQKSATTNFAKMSYLMTDFAISYNNSAGFYLNSKALSNKNSVLCVFPVFEKTDFELAFSKTEMQAIKTNFEGKFFDNEKATFNNFKSNANNFSILHLSTHADAGNTDFPATIKFYEQEIMYSELYNLKINPDLVVLSACQTGLGKLFKSEGSMSIARGFQASGAQNLLFSLWKVNDYTTSVFMTNFYKNIKNKMSFSESNHKAKLDFLSNSEISNAKKSPYYWAPFVYYGTLEKPSNNYWIWILGGIVFGFIGFGMFRWKSKTNI